MSHPIFNLSETRLQPGATLIEASAGTGKTFTIAGLVLRLIVEQGLTIQEILVTTYTVPATAELRDRIRKRLRDAFAAFEKNESNDPFLQALLAKNQACRPLICTRLDRALRHFDEAPIFSLHGFCNRMLGDKAFESGVLFDAELVPDQSHLLREIVDDFWRKQFYSGEPLFASLALKNKIKPGDFLKLLYTITNHPTIVTIPALAISFDDLRRDLLAVFRQMQAIWKRDEPEIRKHFSEGQNGWARYTHGDSAKMAVELERLANCLGEATSAPDFFECLERFTTSAIERATRSKQVSPSNELFELCEKFMKLEADFVLNLKLEFLRWATDELASRKHSENILSFDDLQTRLLNALRSDRGGELASEIRARFKAALIDEFQDTDPIQYEIFSRIYPDHSSFVFLIGDPKQAIYGFRGADIFTYMQAAARAENKFTLGTNFRSETGLVEAVNHVFSRSKNPFFFREIQFSPVQSSGKQDEAPLKNSGNAEAPFHLWFCNEPEPLKKAEAVEKIVSNVAAEIARLLNGEMTLADKKLRPQDIAVLVATHNQATLVQQALHRFSVPNVLHSHDSVFHSREASELLRILESVAEPSRETLLRAALATDVLGLNAEGIENLRHDERTWETWLLRWQYYHEQWANHGFIQMFRRFWLEEKIRLRLLHFSDGERRLTNLLHLSELLHQACVEIGCGVNGLIKWFAEQISNPNSAGEEQELRLERDENAVRIVTMHKSKGLEYPVVFCPFTWESSALWKGEFPKFHDDKNQSRLTQDLGSPERESNEALANQEKLAEKLRLFYVALTRAKSRSYLVWGRFAGAEDSAPNYLFNPPPAPDPDFVSALALHNKNSSPGMLSACIEKLVEGHETQLKITPMPGESAPLYQPSELAGSELKARQFRGQIARDWRIASFSSLTKDHEENAPDHDASIEEEPVTAVQKTGGIFAFPRGTQAGSCLHGIFEALDFQDETQLPELVEKTLPKFGFKTGEFDDALCRMFRNVIRAPLDSAQPEFTLSQIPRRQCLHELEFHFPISRVAPQRLMQHFAQNGRPEIGEFPETIGRLGFSPVRGFLKGFIDLVFQHDGLFYIVDWKSNWLGAEPAAYNRKAMSAEMLRHFYILQYHLYAVALHRYLRVRLSGYDFEKHFGGVFYIFVRGVEPKQPELGIFRDRPGENLIAGLSDLLGEHNE